jgi:UDP-N-acetyl-alpha-D-muramoyl-L-alanyl-L-glutamate epimerase
MSVAAFDPAVYTGFTFSGWNFDEPSMTLSLRYRLGDGLDFVETVDFSSLPAPASEPQRAALQRTFSLLHLLAGTSYYKLASPPHISVGETAVTPGAAGLAEMVFRNGLAEFAWSNQNRNVLALSFEPTAPAPAPVGLMRSGKALVPVGGGKDSIVTLELLRRAGIDAVAFSVGTAASIAQTAAIAGVGHRFVTRRIDAQVARLNASGALNGHVPVTAINSALACAAAILLECSTVVMSNEFTASGANVEWEGVGVNHQWSKGLQFEQALSSYLEDEVSADLGYLSLLRPLSELAIARLFAKMPQYFGVFISCNRYYRRSGATPSWCGECDKCRFVFLVLAPWLAPATLTGIFGANLLDDGNALPAYEVLAGMKGIRPFDCVGEAAEVHAALKALAANPAWKDAAVVAALAPRLKGPAETLMNDALEFHEVGLPPRFEEVVRAAL